MWNQLQNGIQHSQTGTQNGNKHDFALQLATSRALHRSFDVDWFYCEGTGCLIGHECGDFAKHAAKFLRVGALVTQPRKVMLHQWMRDDGYAFQAIKAELSAQ